MCNGNLPKKLKTNIMRLKYVIVEKDGVETPVVFSPLLLHEHMTGKSKVKSAGYCELDVTGSWNVNGQSVSLNCSARPQDAEILNAHL